MKAKLIKIEEGYELLTQGFLKGSTNHELIDSLNVEEGNIRYKLSIKNCQAIERGYDLDDCVDYFEKGKLYIQQDGVIILAGENGNNGIIIQDPLKTRGVGHYSDEWNPKAFCEFKQEALEILGDKKFSESDMIHAYIEGTNDGAQFESMMDYDHSDNSEAQNFSEQAEQDFRKLLQQTEWDVEFEMEYVGECNGNNDNGCFQDSPGHNCGCFERKPKLDADGCLILKKV